RGDSRPPERASGGSQRRAVVSRLGLQRAEQRRPQSGTGEWPVNQDFRDLLAEFNARKVEFLVVGAQALAAHGCVRATRDLDVWVRPQLDNAKRVMSALRAFGSGMRLKPRVILDR